MALRPQQIAMSILLWERKHCANDPFPPLHLRSRLTLCLHLQGRDHSSFVICLKDYIKDREELMQQLLHNAQQHFDVQVRASGGGEGGVESRGGGVTSMSR